MILEAKMIAENARRTSTELVLVGTTEFIQQQYPGNIFGYIIRANVLGTGVKNLGEIC